jgi:hypothetical protein
MLGGRRYNGDEIRLAQSPLRRAGSAQFLFHFIP